MLKPISAIATMVLTISLASISLAQCSSCGTSDVTFGYPGGSCATCNTGGYGGRSHHGEVLRAKIDHAKAYDAKVSARNQAWPKPFNCADRQVYSAIWGPMVDAGFADQTTVSSTHFNKEGQLTRYGKQQIVGILRNMPQDRKVVYVQRDGDEVTTQNRYNQVQQLVSMFYGQSGRVALTDRNPLNQQGLRAEATTNAYYGSLPAPIIPVSDSSVSVSESVSN